MVARAFLVAVGSLTLAVGLSLRRNAIWMVSGQAIFALCQWGMLVVLARFGGPEQVGQFALALAITVPLLVFSQLQLRQIQAVDAAGHHRFADCFIVRLVTTALAAIGIVVIAAFARHDMDTMMVILIVGAAKCFESLSDVFYGLEQRHKRFDLVAQSMISRGVGGLLALVAVTVLTGQPVAGLLAMAAVWALVWFVFDRRVTRHWRRQESAAEPDDQSPLLQRRLRLAWTGLPLAIAVTIGSLNTNVPRYFVEAYLDTAALGVFAALAYFVVAGNVVIQGLCQAAAPDLARRHARSDFTAFRRLLFKLVLFGAAVGGGGLVLSVLFGAEILSLMYGPEFAAHTDLFVWIMLVGLMAYSIVPLGFALMAVQAFRIQPAVQGSALAVNIVCCAIAIPAIGLAGAALGWGAAYLFNGLVRILVLRTRLRRTHPAVALGSHSVGDG